MSGTSAQALTNYGYESQTRKEEKRRDDRGMQEGGGRERMEGEKEEKGGT